MHKHFHIPLKNLKFPKPQHGWGVLFGEIGIIVVGVLIALLAEQVVQSFHWREKTEAAKEALLIEMRDDNAPQAYMRVAVFPCVDSVANRIYAHAADMPTDELRALVNSYLVPFGTYDDQAFRAVQGSDVANHVSAETLIEWAKPYRSTTILTTWSTEEATLIADLRAAMPANGTPTDQDIQNLRRLASELMDLNLHISATSRLMLDRLHKNGIDLPNAVVEETLKTARTYYGSCVRKPNIAYGMPLDGLRSPETLRARVMSGSQ